MYIPQLGKYAESILEHGSSSGRKLAKLQRIARQAVAALCALGGFKETIKIGSEVQVSGLLCFCTQRVCIPPYRSNPWQTVCVYCMQNMSYADKGSNRTGLKGGLHATYKLTCGNHFLKSWG